MQFVFDQKQAHCDTYIFKIVELTVSDNLIWTHFNLSRLYLELDLDIKLGKAFFFCTVLGNCRIVPKRA